MIIIELGSIQDIHGKAGRLNQLYHDFPIARGFILPYENFLKFLSFNHISLQDDRNTIRERIMKGILPFEKELLDYFKKNNYENVIVRSSASIEDSDSYSFAGQFESYANTKIDSLISHIKRCWVSQFSDSVMEYLVENKMMKEFTFDVLIQEMIDTDISGVAFSINPSNGSKEVLAEVANTPCEEVVSGTVIPHLYHIRNQIEADSFFSKDKLLIIQESIQRLKRIFKAEIEIEFGFQKNQFYLFQVRPITRIYFSLVDYINAEFWCSFKNNNWTLFHRSLWILGATRYKARKIHNEVTEDITLYYPHNQKQMRGFNGNQPPLDEITIKCHTDSDIHQYIQESYQLSKEMKELSSMICHNIKDNDYLNFKINLRKLIQKNAILNSYEYLIGSLGNALHDQLHRKTIQNIEKWRNDSSNSYFPIYDTIFEYVFHSFHFTIEFNLFKNYIHVQELLNLCDKKLKPEILMKRIIKRNEYGFVLLNIHEKKYCNKIITDKKVIMTVMNRFHQLYEGILMDNDSNKIKGKSTFKNGKVIVGECILIKDNDTDISKMDLKDKILVCEVTTSKDVLYLKKVKALIVNNGGVLCHSAIFSREFKIPCLMGCQIATEVFRTGDILSYHVDEEFVEKL